MNDRNKEKIFVDAYEGKVESVIQHLKNDQSLLTALDSNERMLIHWAAVGGHTELVHQLIERGSPINPKDDILMTPVILASSAGKFDVVKQLVAAGADVNSQNAQGHSALQYAASKGWKDIVVFLLSEGAEVNIADLRGATPLHRASSIGHLPIVTALLSRNNIDIHACDSEANTPLHLSCEEDRTEVCKLLVERGARLDALNKEKKTPLDLASYNLANVLKSLV